MRSKTIIGLLFCIFWIPACDIQSPDPTVGHDESKATRTPLVIAEATQTPTLVLMESSLPAGYVARGTWIDIYFTDPESPLAQQETGGLDGVLAASIDDARLSVDVAIYSMSLRSIRDALIRAHERGVQVRVVMESKNLDRSAPEALLDAGVPLIGDYGNGLMHDKFVIIDRSEVWLGSMNFTYSGAYEDNNQLIHIRSTKLAENYIKEFEEMFLDGRFGQDTLAETPHPAIRIEGTSMDVLFSPDDGVADHVVEILNDAEESIYFMAFSFTRDDFGKAMRRQNLLGLEVAGVMDEDQIKSNIGTEYDFFKQDSMHVFSDGNEGQMHHKTMIVDEKIVITGSYNFSRSAEIRNDENVIIFYSEPIAAFFLEEFERVFEQAQE